jgi:hypothetical protein
VNIVFDLPIFGLGHPPFCHDKAVGIQQQLKIRDAVTIGRGHHHHRQYSRQDNMNARWEFIQKIQASTFLRTRNFLCEVSL